ncbi:ABC transporter substrate-binding protein [Paenibacillus sp. MWE-103]|uniref:ABC transporter substrate-binding protein n=1 Tax=Paenibacillus artemisiicola TaxID=1172618 RepID=A0ABS3WC01_9BACL|nr:ABC transporter substrate-binding protein [Paenibacillus artemisiicola]MBO7745861.1 ABC transporter substrate-binding protein [Paenibacillus artemisiicola]
MKLRKTALIPLMLASLILLLLASACGSNNGGSGKNDGAAAAGNTGNNAPADANKPDETATNEPANEPAKTDEAPAELTYYYIVYDMPADQQAVEDAINAYIKPKINATVKLKPVMEAGYKDKINTMLAANESFDILWTSNWGGGDYDNKVAKGALLPLDDLLAKTPALKDAIPQVAWDDTRVDGKIYGVPNMQIAAKAEGFAIQKRFIDKYNIDVNGIKSQMDIEPVLKTIHDNEPDIIPIATTSNMFDFGRQYGYAAQGYKLGDPDYKIVDTVDKPEYKTFLDTMRRWYTSGYIYKDAATMKDDQLVSLLNTGKVAVEWNTTMKPGGEIDDKKRFGNNDVVYVRVSEPEFTGVRPTMNAISRTSKNPEKALEFLQLTSTDPTLFNLITFGIQDKHYTVVGDNTIRINQDGGYKGDQGWVFGNVLIGYLKEGQAPDTWERTKQLNETAKRPEVSGFNFNTEPYKTESVNIAAVSEQYGRALNTGAVDPAKVLPKYQEALKKAGVEKQTAEMQKQLDEWLKANGKK